MAETDDHPPHYIIFFAYDATRSRQNADDNNTTTRDKVECIETWCRKTQDLLNRTEHVKVQLFPFGVDRQREVGNDDFNLLYEAERFTINITKERDLSLKKWGPGKIILVGEGKAFKVIRNVVSWDRLKGELCPSAVYFFDPQDIDALVRGRPEIPIKNLGLFQQYSRTRTLSFTRSFSAGKQQQESFPRTWRKPKGFFRTKSWYSPSLERLWKELVKLIHERDEPNKDAISHMHTSGSPSRIEGTPSQTFQPQDGRYHSPEITQTLPSKSEGDQRGFTLKPPTGEDTEGSFGASSQFWSHITGRTSPVLSSASSPNSGSQGSGSVSEPFIFHDVLRYIAKGKYERAETCLRRYEDEHPDEDTSFPRGILAASSGHYSDAIDALERWTRSRDQEGYTRVAQWYLGLSYLLNSQYEDAVQNLDLLLPHSCGRHISQNSRIQRVIDVCHAHMGNYDKMEVPSDDVLNENEWQYHTEGTSRSTHDQLLMIMHQSIHLWSIIATVTVLSMWGHYEKGSKIIQKATEVLRDHRGRFHPDTMRASLLHAKLLIALDNHEAESMILEVKRMPNSPLDELGLGRTMVGVLRNRGPVPEAAHISKLLRDQLEEGFPHHMQTFEACIELSRNYRLIGKYVEAEAKLSGAILVTMERRSLSSPIILSALSELAQIYSCLGAQSDAERLILKVLRSQVFTQFDFALQEPRTVCLQNIIQQLGASSAAFEKGEAEKVVASIERQVTDHQPISTIIAQTSAATIQSLLAFARILKRRQGADSALVLRVLDAVSKWQKMSLGEHHRECLNLRLESNLSRCNLSEVDLAQVVETHGEFVEHVGPDHLDTIRAEQKMLEVFTTHILDDKDIEFLENTHLKKMNPQTTKDIEALSSRAKEILHTQQERLGRNHPHVLDTSLWINEFLSNSTMPWDRIRPLLEGLDHQTRHLVKERSFGGLLEPFLRIRSMYQFHYQDLCQSHERSNQAEDLRQKIQDFRDFWDSCKNSDFNLKIFDIQAS